MSEISEIFDFMPLGEAMKNAREKNGLTREQLPLLNLRNSYHDTCLHYFSPKQ